MFDELPAASRSGYAGEDTRVRCGIDDPVDRREGIEVALAPDVPVVEADAVAFDGLAVSFTARTAEIVDAHEFELRQRVGQLDGERTANEAANSRDQDLHRGRGPSRAITASSGSARTRQSPE